MFQTNQQTTVGSCRKMYFTTGHHALCGLWLFPADVGSVFNQLREVFHNTFGVCLRRRLNDAWMLDLLRTVSSHALGVLTDLISSVIASRPSQTRPHGRAHEFLLPRVRTQRDVWRLFCSVLATSKILCLKTTIGLGMTLCEHHESKMAAHCGDLIKARIQTGGCSLKSA